MAKCLVVYGSKYGATHEVASAVAEGLGADLAEVGSNPEVQAYDLVVIGSPIYAGDYLDSVSCFVKANRSLFQQRKVAAFITAAADVEIAPGLTGDEDELLHTQQDYADGLARLTGGEVVATRGFGGRLVPEQLAESDHKMLAWFYRFLMREELKGFDLLNLPEAKTWGEQLRDMLEG